LKGSLTLYGRPIAITKIL